MTGAELKSLIFWAKQRVGPVALERDVYVGGPLVVVYLDKREAGHGGPFVEGGAQRSLSVDKFANQNVWTPVRSCEKADLQKFEFLIFGNSYKIEFPINFEFFWIYDSEHFIIKGRAKC